MKKQVITLFISAFLAINSISQKGHFNELKATTISLVQSGELNFHARVNERQSYWDVSKTNINTLNQLQEIESYNVLSDGELTLIAEVTDL